MEQIFCCFNTILLWWLCLQDSSTKTGRIWYIYFIFYKKTLFCLIFWWKFVDKCQHGIDALPGMTILSACLETVSEYTFYSCKIKLLYILTQKKIKKIAGEWCWRWVRVRVPTGGWSKWCVCKSSLMDTWVYYYTAFRIFKNKWEKIRDVITLLDYSRVADPFYSNLTFIDIWLFLLNPKAQTILMGKKL